MNHARARVCVYGFVSSLDHSGSLALLLLLLLVTFFCAFQFCAHAQLLCRNGEMLRLILLKSYVRVRTRSTLISADCIQFIVASHNNSLSFPSSSYYYYVSLPLRLIIDNLVWFGQF